MQQTVEPHLWVTLKNYLKKKNSGYCEESQTRRRRKKMAIARLYIASDLVRWLNMIPPEYEIPESESLSSVRPCVRLATSSPLSLCLFDRGPLHWDPDLILMKKEAPAHFTASRLNDPVGSFFIFKEKNYQSFYLAVSLSKTNLYVGHFKIQFCVKSTFSFCFNVTMRDF